jgi:hypothetical protein
MLKPAFGKTTHDWHPYCENVPVKHMECLKDGLCGVRVHVRPRSGSSGPTINPMIVDANKLTAAVDDYFTGFHFTVRNADVLDAGPSSKRVWSSPVSYVSVKVSDMDSTRILEITFEDTSSGRFKVLIPEPFWSPARNPSDQEFYDLEHLIAENLVFSVEDTMHSRTIAELNGTSLPDHWG